MRIDKERFAVVIAVGKLFHMLGDIETIPRFILRRICHKNHVFSRYGVVKFQSVRPQSHVAAALDVAAVANIAEHGAIDGGKLHAYLVRAPRAQLHLDKAESVVCFQHFVVQFGAFGVVIAECGNIDVICQTVPPVGRSNLCTNPR